MSLESPAGHSVKNIPIVRQGDYDHELAALRERFADAETEIRRELNVFVDSRIADHGWTPTAEFCSSWIPGADWTEGSGVYQPIFDTMVGLYVDRQFAHKRAGWFFGLILMDVMIRRTDKWVFKREPRRRDDDPEGLHYYPNVRTTHVAV
jgi:hypothetical protein